MPNVELLLKWGIAERVERVKPKIEPALVFPRHEHGPGICSLPPEIDWMIREAIQEGYPVHEICYGLDKLSYDNYLAREAEFKAEDARLLAEFNAIPAIRFRLNANDVVGWFRPKGGYEERSACLTCATGRNFSTNNLTQLTFQTTMDAKIGKYVCENCKLEVLHSFGNRFKLGHVAKDEEDVKF